MFKGHSKVITKFCKVTMFLVILLKTSTYIAQRIFGKIVEKLINVINSKERIIHYISFLEYIRVF